MAAYYAGRLTRKSGRASVDMQMLGVFIYFFVFSLLYLCLLYLYLVPPQRAGIALAVTARVPSRTNNQKKIIW
jgi:hypothetical protein